jgi:hypothetical protein
MEETKPKVIRSEEYKAKNREICLRRYYEKMGKEYKPRKSLTDEEKEAIAYKSYLLNKERSLARYYRLRYQTEPPKEEQKELTDEQKKTKEYFKKYYQEHKEQYKISKQNNEKIKNNKKLKTLPLHNNDLPTVAE